MTHSAGLESWCEKTIRPESESSRILKTGILAGLAGGTAEILWIGLYGALTGTPVAAVARAVTSSLFPAADLAGWAIGLGLAIHMALAVALGVALTAALRSSLVRATIPASESVVAVAALAGVWAINFFVVLPWLNPDFVTLLPYAVSFVSKVLFGLAVAVVLRLGPALGRPMTAIEGTAARGPAFRPPTPRIRTQEGI